MLPTGDRALPFAEVRLRSDPDRGPARARAGMPPRATLRRGGRVLVVAAGDSRLPAAVRARGDRGAGHSPRAPTPRPGGGEGVCVEKPGKRAGAGVEGGRAVQAGAARAEDEHGEHEVRSMKSRALHTSNLAAFSGRPFPSWSSSRQPPSYGSRTSARR